MQLILRDSVESFLLNPSTFSNALHLHTELKNTGDVPFHFRGKSRSN